MIHIGSKIQEVYQKTGMKRSAFAYAIDLTPNVVYNIFKRESIDTTLLLKISKALSHDFFQYFSDEENTPIVKEPEPNYSAPKKMRIMVEVELSEIEYRALIGKAVI